MVLVPAPAAEVGCPFWAWSTAGKHLIQRNFGCMTARDLVFYSRWVFWVSLLNQDIAVVRTAPRRRLSSWALAHYTCNDSTVNLKSWCVIIFRMLVTL